MLTSPLKEQQYVNIEEKNIPKSFTTVVSQQLQRCVGSKKCQIRITI